MHTVTEGWMDGSTDRQRQRVAEEEKRQRGRGESAQRKERMAREGGERC
jgi:hypothetical protein